jgi:hypothetical protein
VVLRLVQPPEHAAVAGIDLPTRLALAQGEC